MCHLSPNEVDALTVEDFDNLCAGVDQWIDANKQAADQ